MNKRYVITGIMAVAALLVGCGDSHSADKQEVTNRVSAYVNDFSTKNFASLLPILSGDALRSVQSQMNTLKNMNVQNVVKNIQVSHIDFPDSDHALAEGSYLLTQTVPGYGTSEDNYTVEYYLRKVDGTWKVYATQTEIDAPATGNHA